MRHRVFVKDVIPAGVRTRRIRPLADEAESWDLHRFLELWIPDHPPQADVRDDELKKSAGMMNSLSSRPTRPKAEESRDQHLKEVVDPGLAKRRPTGMTDSAGMTEVIHLR